MIRITGRAAIWGKPSDASSRVLGQARLSSLGIGLAVWPGPDGRFSLGAKDHGGTQIRFGGERVELRSGGTLDDAAFLLVGLARGNVRAMQADPVLREEAIRRVLSPPIDRCHVRSAERHDCTGQSGFQYASDEEQQTLEGCKPSDVWSDMRALLAGHESAGRGSEDAVVCDCDDLAPAAAGAYAWLSWFGEDGMKTPKGSWYGEGKPIAGIGKAMRDARFAIAITRPPRAPIAHAYVLTSRPPAPPQPPIQMGSWWVLDPAAHWGMPRPPDDFYRQGEVVAHELSRDSLQSMKVLP